MATLDDAYTLEHFLLAYNIYLSDWADKAFERLCG